MTRSLASLKSFYTYLMGKGLVAVNPARGLSPARVERKLPHILTSKEVELFLEQPDPLRRQGLPGSGHAGAALRHRHPGVGAHRPGSGERQPGGGLPPLRRPGKGADDPLYPAAVQALEDYITHVRPQMVEHPDERALFVNMSGERMSRQGFWKIIKHYQEKAASRRRSLPTPCATPSPPTCWRTGRISTPSRRCWATRISPPPRSTPSW